MLTRFSVLRHATLRCASTWSHVTGLARSAGCRSLTLLLSAAPADPILGLVAQFKLDTHDPKASVQLTSQSVLRWALGEPGPRRIP